MKIIVGLGLIALGVACIFHACNTAPNLMPFLYGLTALVSGFRLLPDGASVQARVRHTARLGLRV